MAIEPAAISASPAVTTSVEACGFEAMAPEIPAASANGTVRPSDIPMTTSRTDSGAVKWCSVCGVAGIRIPRAQPFNRKPKFPAIRPKPQKCSTPARRFHDVGIDFLGALREDLKRHVRFRDWRA